MAGGMAHQPWRPSQMLTNAALALLAGREDSAALARQSGHRDAAALGRALRRELFITPEALSRLGRDGQYTIAYGGPFHVAQTLRYLGRDPENLAERVDGSSYRRLFPVGGRNVPATLILGKNGCRVELGDALDPAGKLALHCIVVRGLGLDQPLRAFYRHVRGHAVMEPLIKSLRGVTVPQVPSLWEGLCWAIIGQQINLSFAYRLRNRLIALCSGARAPYCPPYPFPTPEQVLKIPPPAWREAQFSRQKTDYLIGLARMYTDGRLCEQTLRDAPDEAVESTLRAIRGLGSWSVAYGLLRAFGRIDALPVGDAGLRTALMRHYNLPAPPDSKQQVALMESCRPYRGLATYYLWKSLDRLRQE